MAKYLLTLFLHVSIAFKIIKCHFNLPSIYHKNIYGFDIWDVQYDASSIHTIPVLSAWEITTKRVHN